VGDHASRAGAGVDPEVGTRCPCGGLDGRERRDLPQAGARAGLGDQGDARRGVVDRRQAHPRHPRSASRRSPTPPRTAEQHSTKPAPSPTPPKANATTPSTAPRATSANSPPPASYRSPSSRTASSTPQANAVFFRPKRTAPSNQASVPAFDDLAIRASHSQPSNSRDPRTPTPRQHDIAGCARTYPSLATRTTNRRRAGLSSGSPSAGSSVSQSLASVAQAPFRTAQRPVRRCDEALSPLRRVTLRPARQCGLLGHGPHRRGRRACSWRPPTGAYRHLC
jgi:hypothetical protein